MVTFGVRQMLLCPVTVFKHFTTFFLRIPNFEKPIHKLLPIVNADEFDLSTLKLVKQLSDLRIGVQQLRLGSHKGVHRFLISLAGIAVCPDGEQISIIHFFNDIHSYSPYKIDSKIAIAFNPLEEKFEVSNNAIKKSPNKSIQSVIISLNKVSKVACLLSFFNSHSHITRTFQP